MVTPSRRIASFYCYVRWLKLFIILSNNALNIKIQEIVVPLLYDVISKYDIIASTPMVAIGFSLVHGECNQALQMASTEKAWNRDSNYILSAARWHSVQNITRKSSYAQETCSKPHSIFRVAHMQPQASTIRKEEGEKNYTGVTDVSGECVGKRQAFNG